jgi:hypothetical protein
MCRSSLRMPKPPAMSGVRWTGPEWRTWLLRRRSEAIVRPRSAGRPVRTDVPYPTHASRTCANVIYEATSRRPISTNMLAKAGSRKRSEMRVAR